MIATSRAAQQAAELRRAELDASNGFNEETSIAGVLVFALTPQGGTSALAGLLDLIERQLFAASTAEAGGQETSPWTEAAHRLTHAAIEINRRERAGCDAERAERAERAEEDEDTEEAEEAEEAE